MLSVNVMIFIIAIMHKVCSLHQSGSEGQPPATPWASPAHPPLINEVWVAGTLHHLTHTTHKPELNLANTQLPNHVLLNLDVILQYCQVLLLSVNTVEP